MSVRTFLPRALHLILGKAAEEIILYYLFFKEDLVSMMYISELKHATFWSHESWVTLSHINSLIIKINVLPFSSNILYTTSTILSVKSTSVTVLATCLNVSARKRQKKTWRGCQKSLI